jgi:hypothetical protein
MCSEKWDRSTLLRDNTGRGLGATLTVRGLLIGFSCFDAVSRYDQRNNSPNP